MTSMDNSAMVPIGADDADALSALCRAIYPQSFTYLWDDAGAWYTEATYNADTLRAEIADANARFYFLEVDGRRVGYLKLKLERDLDGEPGGLEIERIYLLREYAGQGLGARMMAFALDIARQLHRRYAWLHSMDSSTDSIAFYERQGFAIVGETWLPFEHMLPEYRRMWKMRKPLDA
jgi:ribosomal protein S18 acetylase RimI-like enzyme